jgi:hypothetical protein
MKYTALLRQVQQLRRQLGELHGLTIRIEGGLPAHFEMPQPAPPGADLAHQAAIFGKRSRQAPAEPVDAPAAADPPQTAPAIKGARKP